VGAGTKFVRVGWQVPGHRHVRSDLKSQNMKRYN
jgi:hypothetical protein